jgi:Uma2 family endonuclease
MAIKLAILKSGEDVIADIKELVSEDDKVISLVFSNPFSVKLSVPQFLLEEGETETRKYDVSVYPWMPLSEDKDIAISPDWVVTIVEPAETLKKSYEDRVNGRRNKDTDSSTDLDKSVEFNN